TTNARRNRTLTVDPRHCIAAWTRSGISGAARQKLARDSCLSYEYRSGPPRVRLVKRALEPLVRTADAIDDRLRPVEILTPPLQGPVVRRVGCDITHIGNLVGELHQPRPAREMLGVLDLQALAIGPGQRLVVGHFPHDAGDR